MRELSSPFTAQRRLTRFTPQAVSGKAAAIPIALTAVVLTLFVPEELSFYIMGLRFTVVRLLFILLFPALLLRLGAKVSSGRYRFVLSDLFVFVTGFWMIYAPANLVGMEQALNHAGPTALEFCVGYLATRVMLSEHGQALSFISMLCRVIAVVALLALLDPITNHYLIHEVSAELTGYQKQWNGDFANVHRMGLLRATGPIEHPILFAITCTIGLLIAMSVPIRSRSFVIIACTLGAIFAFTSAAIQAIAIGVTLLVYNRVLAGFPGRWGALIALGVAGIAALFLVSDAPIGIIVRHLIFDPASGYYRWMTWDQVIAAVTPSPWFGLGFGPYPQELDINHSIDSLWLVAAIQFGVPGAILIALSMLGAASLPAGGSKVSLTPAEAKLGTTLGILIFLIMFLAFTVDFWGITWILSGLLLGVRAHLGELGRVGRTRAAVQRSGRPQVPAMRGAAGVADAGSNAMRGAPLRRL